MNFPEKSGKRNTGAEISACLRLSKAVWHLSVHIKTVFFLSSALKSFTITEKFATNFL